MCASFKIRTIEPKDASLKTDDNSPLSDGNPVPFDETARYRTLKSVASTEANVNTKCSCPCNCHDGEPKSAIHLPQDEFSRAARICLHEIVHVSPTADQVRDAIEPDAELASIARSPTTPGNGLWSNSISRRGCFYTAKMIALCFSYSQIVSASSEETRNDPVPYR